MDFLYCMWNVALILATFIVAIIGIIIIAVAAQTVFSLSRSCRYKWWEKVLCAIVIYFIACILGFCILKDIPERWLIRFNQHTVERQ